MTAPVLTNIDTNRKDYRRNDFSRKDIPEKMPAWVEGIEMNVFGEGGPGYRQDSNPGTVQRTVPAAQQNTVVGPQTSYGVRKRSG